MSSSVLLSESDGDERESDDSDDSEDDLENEGGDGEDEEGEEDDDFIDNDDAPESGGERVLRAFMYNVTCTGLHSP